MDHLSMLNIFPDKIMLGRDVWKIFIKGSGCLLLCVKYKVFSPEGECHRYQIFDSHLRCSYCFVIFYPHCVHWGIIQ